MATTQSHAPDLTAEEQPTNPDNMKEQDSAAIVHPSKAAPQSGSVGSAGDFTGYLPNIYAPQAQSFYYRGYEHPMHEWDDYPPYINAEGLEIKSPGGFSDNPSLVFHTGYSYSPQIPYGPYSPAASPIPSVTGDAQLYSPQQFPFSGPPAYYQQVVPHSMPYSTSPTPVSRPDLTSLVGVNQQGDNNNMLMGPRPNYHHYHPSVGSFGGSGFHGNPGNLGFPDWHQGFDGGIWSDWSKNSSDRQRSMAPVSLALSPQPTGPLGSFRQNVPMGSQRQRSYYGIGSGSNSYNRGYMHSGGLIQGSNYGNTPVSNLGMTNQGWLTLDNSRSRGNNTASSFCGCNGTLDILNEQNRGPRASKPKTQITEELNSSTDNMKHIKTSAKNHEEPGFVTDYKDAKFFVIKSYSEDNVHKSIKYNVWASTPNGNKKLDTAYREAKEKEEQCPMFLFFSVNASAQFCGVAEMVGPVDFERSVDYWQQDKWSGQFPVKWHIIKDVPNNQFRHIILETNDNKPVTNSRDTQEVKLEQGIEMLKIFMNNEADTSILEDFDFYEEREKVIQERKARREASLTSVGIVGENDLKTGVALPTDFIKHMSKSFAEVVRLDEGGKVADQASSLPDATKGTVVSSGQAN